MSLSNPPLRDEPGGAAWRRWFARLTDIVNGALSDIDTTEASITTLQTQSLTSGTVQATTAGTAIEFTSIPSWVTKITISLVGVSTSGTSALAVQIGDSGGFETTGYLGAGANLPNAAANAVLNSTAVFLCMHSSAAAAVYHGVCVLTLVNVTTNTWSFASTLGRSDAASSQVGAGSKSLTGTLDRVRLTTAGGADTFDAGSVNILYE